jgi:hypothetical protein
MTAASQQAPRTPPRFVVRTLWLLHRAAYRLTGGGFGLSRPVAGSKFGMLRLTTIGRRSGQSRGDKEPAWWLNLQAVPETIVELPGETRAVRARAAAGEERDRLWATFSDYPGWGDDIDALARRRSSETAVVVFEPRAAAGEIGVAS